MAVPARGALSSRGARAERAIWIGPSAGSTTTAKAVTVLPRDRPLAGARYSRTPNSTAKAAQISQSPEPRSSAQMDNERHDDQRDERDREHQHWDGGLPLESLQRRQARFDGGIH